MATSSASLLAAVLVTTTNSASCLQAMHRMGHWPQEAIARGHVPFFKAPLLAAANWPGADCQNEFAKAFWHERFLIEVPEEVLLLVFSELEVLETRVCGCHCCLQLPNSSRCSCFLDTQSCNRPGQAKFCCIVLKAA